MKQRVNQTWLLVQPLEEEVTYTFSVRAQTIDFGVSIKGNVTTGPQAGSPKSPFDLSLVKTVSSVALKWKNGPSGKGPILGYYIQSRRKGKNFRCNCLLLYYLMIKKVIQSSVKLY